MQLAFDIGQDFGNAVVFAAALHGHQMPCGCDGQVQVWHDLLSYSTTFVPQHMPRHVKQYAHVGETMRTAIEQYGEEVRAGTFPTTRESFAMNKAVLAELAETNA